MVRKHQSPADSVNELWIKKFTKITLVSTVCEINVILRFTQKKREPKISENNFWEKLPVDCAHTLGIKNFVEITLSSTISEINVFLCFIQKLKIPPENKKKSPENNFWEQSPADSMDALQVKNFSKITLVSEINVILSFTQKYKIAAKIGRKTIFLEKSPVHCLNIHGGQTFCQNRSILHCFQDKCVFMFYADIQDGLQKWRENKFCCQLTLHIA